jgi:hypothetical protein
MAGLDETELKRYLDAVAKLSAETMRDGIRGQHTGRVGYRKGGGRFIRSANVNKEEFPASDSGRLLASVKGVSFGRKAFVSAQTPYSGYLRSGTPKMEARKMTVEALDAGIRKAANLRTGFVEWMRTRNR